MPHELPDLRRRAQFLLRPDREIEEVYLYCLAVAAERYGMRLHGWIAMSNHHHLVVTDVHGRLPAFLALLHLLIARCVNAHRGRWENLWATEQPSAVWLVEASDRFDKLVYLLANPVADDLVDRISDWPGATSLRASLGGSAVHVRRPRGFFGEDSQLPDVAELRADRLPGYEELSHDDWKSTLCAALEKAEEDARAKRLAEKRTVFGRKRVLGVEPTSTPTSVEPRRALRPTLACKDIARRKLELALIRGFRAAYEQALKLWRAGVYETLFPAGTYKMLWYGARAEDPSSR